MTNDAGASLTEVLRHCTATARRHRQAAERLGNQRTVGVLNRLAASREGIAEQLTFHLSAMPDRPGVQGAASGASIEERAIRRAAERGPEALLQQCLADEERLSATASAALDCPVPAPVRSALERLRSDARQAAARLRKAIDAG
ncbi:MAG: hypothetical protein PVH31_00970 [Ectothiorhodospiraceae bacterium]|jgi:hypothetical protein